MIVRLLFLITFCWAWSFAQTTPQGVFRSLPDTTPHPLPIQRIDSIWMVSAAELGVALGTPVLWQSTPLQLQLGASTWTPSNPWVSVGDTALFLNKPVQLQSDHFWIPLVSALPALQMASGRGLDFDSSSIRLTAQSLKDVQSVSLNTLDNGELLHIQLTRKTRVEKFHNAPHFIIRLEGITLDSLAFAGIAHQSKLISRLIPIQDKKTAQITLQLKPHCESAELIERDNGKTLQIILRKKPTPSSSSKISSSSAAKQAVKGKLRTIILDPGHGGKDPGAVGYKKIQEKDIVLKVAQKLEKKLKAKGFQVKLTRSDDTFIDLSERPAMASKWGGDLFISLHCNAVDGAERQKRTEGFKFYILREAESEEDKAIARRENKAIELSASKKGKSEISPVEWILLENQLNLYTKESERFTGFLVDSYEGGKIKKMSSGAGQAGFMVLVGAFMPAVLVEIGFITHPDDAQWMASDKGQHDIANRLLKAIEAYNKALGS